MKELIHEGNRPERLGTGQPESVVAELWKEYIEIGAVDLYDILPRRVTQRDAYVSASLIQYLGTKGGCLLLERIKKRAIRHRILGNAFLKEWKHSCTYRAFGVNHGYTSFELILTETRLFPIPMKHADPEYAKPATRRELQVSRAIMSWLASPIGQCFLQQMEGRIKAQEKDEHWKFHLRAHLGVRAIPA